MLEYETLRRKFDGGVDRGAVRVGLTFAPELATVFRRDIAAHASAWNSAAAALPAHPPLVTEVV
jgi:hypothetical protein